MAGVAGHVNSDDHRLSMATAGVPWRRWMRFWRNPNRKTKESGDLDRAAGGAIDLLSDWICGLDRMGRITYANATLTRDYGCAPGMLSGRPFIEIVPPAARDAVRMALNRAAGSDAPQACQHETLTAGGGSWRQWTFQRLPSDHRSRRSTARILATGRDITEQKRLEHQFLHAQRVGSIGMLASGIAHDLNNVLAPIVMSVDLLKYRIGSEEN